MKVRFQRIICVVLSVVLAVSSISFSASAAVVDTVKSVIVDAPLTALEDTLNAFVYP